MKKAHRKLHGNEITKEGDRPAYVDGTIGRPLASHEVGMRVSDTGYFAIYRKPHPKRSK